MEFIKPIFRDLSDIRLLQKCLGSKTQNSNESLNNIIWRFIPKGTFVRLKTLMLGVYMAVSSFNDGAVILSKVLEECGLNPGQNLVYGCQRVDQRRIYAAEKAQDELKKKIRQHKNLLKRRLEDKFEEEEGEEPSYGPGLY